MTQLSPTGRLALRAEGIMWNAYWAHPNTMSNALLIGSIRLAFVTEHQARKQAFIEMIQGVCSDLLKDVTGVAPKWGEPAGAPEHERASNG